MRGPFLKLWLLCGALDAAYASALTMLRGDGDLGKLWRGVAAGPFGDAAQHWGAGGALLGLGVHFGIMAAMVVVGIWLAQHTQLGQIAPWKAGTFYGLVLYSIMYGIVLHFRFGAPFPNPDRIKLALGLFPHVFFVGLPIFYAIRRRLQPS